MNGVVATIVVVVLSALTLFALRDDAMDDCMKQHSAEVCYHTLAR